MKYAFFPGCVLEGIASEAYSATFKVAKELGIEIHEIEGWTCCGATHVQDIDTTTGLTINARNISLAEKMGMPIMTVCNTCTLMLRSAKAELDNGEKDRINALLKEGELKYQGTSEITHLLWILVRDYGLDKLKAKIKRPLTGMKIAPYYGCHILRPSAVMGFEDHYNPHSLEDLIRILGAEPIEYDAKLKCCGFHAVFPAEQDALKLTGQNCKSAIEVNADAVVTPCPLCQMQLDAYQPGGRAKVGVKEEVTVLHLQQLVGLALGMSPKELGITKHVAINDKFMVKIK